jgi:putative ABC transport system ATP-binding protein
VTKSIIELKKADLTLGNAAASVHVLKNIDLSIGESEAVGIVGPSGSGKSTLLMVLAGLERLDSGERTHWRISAAGISALFSSPSI